MAKLDRCSFCGRNSIGICRCVVQFGRRAEKKVKAWKLVCGNKAFPLGVQKMLSSRKWKVYSEYICQLAAEAKKDRGASQYARSLAKKFERKINSEIARKFGADEYRVVLSAKCVREIRYA